MSDLDETEIDRLIQFNKEYPPESISLLKIYLQSAGGFIWVKNVIVDILKDYKNVHIYIINADSAAFDLLDELDCRLIVDDHSTAIVHLSSTRLTVMAGGYISPLSFDRQLEIHSLNELDRYKEKMDRLKFTFQEKEAVLRGEDICLGKDRLKVIFSDKIIAR